MTSPQELNIAVLRIEGTNCEDEAAAAFSQLGCNTEQVHLKQLLAEAQPHRQLSDYDALFIPGGFSAGDYVRAGAIFAARLRAGLRAPLDEYINSGAPVLGVCNGFQILVEAGMLPGALMRNASLKFVCREVKLEVANNDTDFTRAYDKGQILRCPVAHHDGNYFLDADELKSVEGNDQVVFRYAEGTNPNGSLNDIAGVINTKGNVLGMMPHPENLIEAAHGGNDGRGLFASALGVIAA